MIDCPSERKKVLAHNSQFVICYFQHLSLSSSLSLSLSLVRNIKKNSSSWLSEFRVSILYCDHTLLNKNQILQHCALHVINMSLKIPEKSRKVALSLPSQGIEIQIKRRRGVLDHHPESISLQQLCYKAGFHSKPYPLCLPKPQEIKRRINA